MEVVTNNTKTMHEEVQELDPNSMEFISYMEKWDRCRHLLYYLTNELELENPSWAAVSQAYIDLAQKVGVYKIAEQINEENEEND